MPNEAAAPEPAPGFDLPTAGGGQVRLADYAGRNLVLYFYPKADTSGCTVQAKDFEAARETFARLDASVVGISRDPVRKLDAFAAKHGLTFPLATDEAGQTLEAYGVWVDKSMYGRSYKGIDRSTFLIGPDGTIVRTWRHVRVPGHLDEIVRTLAGGDP